MIEINVRAETEALRYLAIGLTGKEINRAVSRAINRTLSETRSSNYKGIKKLITKDYNLPPSHVDKEGLKVLNSSATTMTGKIMAGASPESLAHFPATAINHGQRTITKKQKKSYKVKTGAIKRRGKVQAGVQVEVVTGKKETIKTGFMVFNNGKPLIMARGTYKGPSGFMYGKARLPIQRLNSKSVYWATLHPHETAAWQPFAQEVYIKRITHEFTTGLRI